LSVVTLTGGTSITGTAIGIVLVLQTPMILPSNFLSLVSLSDLDICEAIKPL